MYATNPLTVAIKGVCHLMNNEVTHISKVIHALNEVKYRGFPNSNTNTVHRVF